ncbi:MAG: efflux RND transporter permease subunit, partial [Alphaproteobacteria bacterium]|nr:efflux RND transporter permease subunit [Alphaproteobacteria bacterium]
VISLAGIAFAVGMVVDAAIVVLENIYRLRQNGLTRADAAYRGAAEVWPAVLVSALTTVMVFIPILLMELEVGQLFRDIAVAISVSVMLSLLVSITMIPALANRLLVGNFDKGKTIKIPIVDGFARVFVAFWIGFTRQVVRSKMTALGVVALITAVAVGTTLLFLPKLDYLPTGNRNFVFGFVQPPAGYNLNTVNSLTERIADRTRKNWASETGPESAPGEPPKFKRFIRVAFNGRAFIGGTSVDPNRVRELIPMMQAAAFQEPGTFAFVFQPSLFGRSVGGGRAIDVDIFGADLDTIFSVGRQAFFKLLPLLPPTEGHRIRPLPALTLGAPEVRIIPDRVALADNGLSARDLGQSIDAFNDGLRISEITVDGKRIDLTLMGPIDNIGATQDIGALPVVTRDGRVVSVDSLAQIKVTRGPTEIRRTERVRTMTLRVTPADSMPLQTAIELIEEDVIAPLEEAGLPDGVRFRISGTADKLTETWNEIVLDLMLAIVIVYLVMAILFESFIYPLIILLSVPIAAAGGVAGLALLNRSVFQPLDMLTMLGFIILIGIVVNNAILLIHQTLLHIRVDGLPPDEAITRATRNRVRPIFMSTLTSVVGMLPLVLFPGAGSELYRGLGSVVVGGLALSAVLTLAVVPPMMSISVGLFEGKRSKSQPEPTPQGAE